MARSPQFGRHPKVQYVRYRKTGNQAYSLAEILATVYCTVDLRLDRHQTRNVLYDLHLSDREFTSVPGLLRFWLFNPPERAANRNFVEAWGWPRLKKGESMLDRLTGKGSTRKKETISREHFGPLYAALMNLGIQPGNYWHPQIPEDLDSIMPPKRNYNTILLTELMSHPSPKEVRVAWSPHMGYCLRRAREATGCSQYTVIREARSYTRSALHQSTLSKYESTEESPSNQQTIRGDILKAIIKAIWLPEEKLATWLTNGKGVVSQTDRAHPDNVACEESSGNGQRSVETRPPAGKHESRQLAIAFDLGAQTTKEEGVVTKPDRVKQARQMNGHGVKISLDANWTRDDQKKEMVRQMLLAAHTLSMPVTINDEPWEASQNGDGYEYRTVPKTI